MRKITMALLTSMILTSCSGDEFPTPYMIQLAVEDDSAEPDDVAIDIDGIDISDDSADDDTVDVAGDTADADYLDFDSSDATQDTFPDEDAQLVDTEVSDTDAADTDTELDMDLGTDTDTELDTDTLPPNPCEGLGYGAPEWVCQDSTAILECVYGNVADLQYCVDLLDPTVAPPGYIQFEPTCQDNQCVGQAPGPELQALCASTDEDPHACIDGAEIHCAGGVVTTVLCDIGCADDYGVCATRDNLCPDFLAQFPTANPIAMCLFIDGAAGVLNCISTMPEFTGYCAIKEAEFALCGWRSHTDGTCWMYGCWYLSDGDLQTCL